MRDKSCKLDKIYVLTNSVILCTCDENLLDAKEAFTAKIMLKNPDNVDSEYTYVLAYWVRGSTGFSLKFVNNRPFSSCDKDTFWGLAEFGQKLLDTYYDQLQYLDWWDHTLH